MRIKSHFHINSFVLLKTRFETEAWGNSEIIIKMFNRHILALKMDYNVFTRFEKLQKPNWDGIYKIIKSSKTDKSYINFNQSY